MKEITLLFLGSALLSMGCRALLRNQRRHRSASRAPLDQRTCFHTLTELLGPTCAIECQIPLGDLFEIRPERGRQTLYPRLAGLRLDFLLADSDSGLPLCAISLDDHLPRASVIDRLFAAHDLLLLRIPRRHLAAPARFRERLSRINRPAPRHSPPRSGARDSG